MEQILINGIIAASIYALVGIGFSLIYSTTRFFHFAHAATFTAGAYFTYSLKEYVGLPLFFSVLIGVLMCGILGYFMDVLLFSQLRRRGASVLIMLLASLGLYVVLQNAISLSFGDRIKSIRSGLITEGSKFLGARITQIQLVTVFLSILIFVTLSIALKKTNMGRTLRAVSNNPMLARVSGIDSEVMINITFVLGSAIAGLAGILVAMDIDITPSMGMLPIMMGIVTVVIAGARNLPGIILGAILLGLAQNIGTWYMSSQWQDAIAFVVLIAFLLFRPEGFLGKKLKKSIV